MKRKSDLLRAIELNLLIERFIEAWASFGLQNQIRKNRKQARLLAQKGVL